MNHTLKDISRNFPQTVIANGTASPVKLTFDLKKPKVGGTPLETLLEKDTDEPNGRNKMAKGMRQNYNFFSSSSFGWIELDKYSKVNW